MEERIGLVFSWDPRARHWVKERGPEDAPPPPADPIDNEAVQTYFLDPQTGRWNGTILGLKARQMSVELGPKYRNARMVGLAIIANAAPKTTRVQTPDQPKKAPVPLMAGIATVVVVIAAGAFAAQAMRPTAVVGVDPSQTAVVQATTTPDPSAAPSAASSEAPTASPSDAPAQTPTRTAPPRTPAPTAPPQTVSYSARLTNGSTVNFSGPGTVTRLTIYGGSLSLRTPNGAPGSEPINLYFGQLGNAQTLTLSPDPSGNYYFNLKVEVPSGTQPISISVGKNGEIRTLGTVVVR